MIVVIIPFLIVGFYMLVLYGIAEVLPHYWRLGVRAWTYYFMLEMLCLMLTPAEAMQAVGFEPTWGLTYIIAFMKYFPGIIVDCILHQRYDYLILLLVPVIPALITYRWARADDRYVEEKRRKRASKNASLTVKKQDF